MSRRLNRDPLPLHKPEAWGSNILQWPDLARGGCYTTLNCFAGFLNGLSMGMYLRWSLTYVATPIAVAVRERPRIPLQSMLRGNAEIRIQ